MLNLSLEDLELLSRMGYAGSVADVIPTNRLLERVRAELERQRRLAGDQVGDELRLDAGDAILLDRLGAAPIETRPEGTLAIVLDVGGRLNKRTDDVENRYLMRPGQAVELVTELVTALIRAGVGTDDLDAAMERRQAEDRGA